MSLPKPYYDEDGITIYCGDALPTLAALPDKSIDLLMTDPPYSSGGMVRSDRIMKVSDKYHQGDEPEFGGDNRDQHAHQWWVALWITEARRVLRDSEIVGIFTDWRQLAPTIDAIQAGGLIYRGVVVWDKTEAARGFPGRFAAQSEYLIWGSKGPRGDRYKWALNGVFRTPAPRGLDREHMTQKPVDLLRELVGVAPKGGTVLDPFMGSGTTLVAAKQLGRRAIGIEIEERYCAIAVERLRQTVLRFDEPKREPTQPSLLGDKAS